VADQENLVNMNQWQNLTKYLETIESDLKSAAPRNTGVLRDSISASFQETGNGFQIGLSMEDYGVYQDQGVNGTERSWGAPFSYRDKMPPPSAFSSYTSDKGAQWAIAKSIQKNGIRPKNFIEPTLDRHLDQLGDFAVEDIWDYFYQQNK